MSRLDDLERRIEALERELRTGITPAEPWLDKAPSYQKADCGCPSWSVCGNAACPRALRPYSSTGDVRA